MGIKTLKLLLRKRREAEADARQAGQNRSLYTWAAGFARYRVAEYMQAKCGKPMPKSLEGFPERAAKMAGKRYITAVMGIDLPGKSVRHRRAQKIREMRQELARRQAEREEYARRGYTLPCYVNTDAGIRKAIEAELHAHRRTVRGAGEYPLTAISLSEQWTHAVRGVAA